MSSIKKELVGGVFYIAIAKYSGTLVQLIITAVLARLLTPSDFGVVAVATVIITFFNILSDIGIGPAIIQNKELTQGDLNTIFSFTCYVGVVIALFFFLLSWPISSYYDDCRLESVCQWLCIPLFCYCLNIVPQNLLYKQRRFKYIAFSSLFVQVISGVSSVTAAMLGMGLYALVLSQIISAVSLFLIYYNKERVEFCFFVQKKSLLKIMSFSIYQFLFNIVNYFSRNFDKLIIGRFIGMEALGYYEKSYRLMMLPLSKITFVVTPVMQPVFSNFQHDLKEMSEKYLKVLRLLSLVSFPLSVLLFFTSEELVYIFFGSQWSASVESFRILSLTVSLQILTSTSGSIYQSSNATKKLFVSGCWGALFMVSSFVLSVWIWGSIEAVSCGFLIAQIFNSFQCFYLLFRVINVRLNSLVDILKIPIIIGFCVGAVLLVFQCFVKIESSFVLLVLKVFITLIIVMLLIQIYGEYDVMKWLCKKIETIRSKNN